MNIPQMFTRTSFCERCAYNQLPYQSSEDIHRHKLRFFVRKNNKGKHRDFELRKQTKPGKLGCTPHLFVVEKITTGAEGKKLYHGFKVCCIENCGLVIIKESLGKLTFKLEKVIKCTWYEEELVHLYNFHDETFMLDTKEMQVYIEPGIIEEIDPN